MGASVWGSSKIGHSCPRPEHPELLWATVTQGSWFPFAVCVPCFGWAVGHATSVWRENQALSSTAERDRMDLSFAIPEEAPTFAARHQSESISSSSKAPQTCHQCLNTYTQLKDTHFQCCMITLVPEQGRGLGAVGRLGARVGVGVGVGVRFLVRPDPLAPSCLTPAPCSRGRTMRCARAVRKLGSFRPVFPGGQGEGGNYCVPIHRTAQIFTQ